MEARKANKVYQIDKAQAQLYAAQGYDVYDGGKKVLNGAGKVVGAEEHERALAEIEKLKRQLAEAKRAK